MFLLYFDMDGHDKKSYDDVMKLITYASNHPITLYPWVWIYTSAIRILIVLIVLFLIIGIVLGIYDNSKQILQYCKYLYGYSNIQVEDTYNINGIDVIDNYA